MLYMCVTVTQALKSASRQLSHTEYVLIPTQLTATASR